MTPIVRVHFFTRRGDRRAQLEDALMVGPLTVTRPMVAPHRMEVATDGPLVAAVFDGMGGHAAGHRASALGAFELADLLSVGARRSDDPVPMPLREALAEAGRRVVDDSASAAGRADMGTTTAGVVLTHGDLDAFNVGDSRVYLLIDGYLCQHSTDDVGPTGGLTQVLGGGLRDIHGHVAAAPPRAEPVALLCTDGLCRNATDHAIEEAMQSPDPIDALWKLAQGAHDDVAVVVLDARPSQVSVTASAAEGLLGDPLPGDEHPDVRPRWRSWLRRRPPAH